MSLHNIPYQNRSLILVAMLLAALLGACSSVTSRIRENEKLFATFPPEAQAQIQNGRIDHGFTEDMVYMARGKPDSKGSFQRNNKTVVVWNYSKRDWTGSPVEPAGTLSTPYGYPGFGPGAAQQPAPLYYDNRVLKIEFEDGKVVGWDHNLQEDLPADVKIQGY